MTTNVVPFNTEEIVSHTIRANHEIITSIERAKSAMEDITYRAPDIFGIMTLDGRIIRGNQALSRLLAVDEEDVYGAAFSSMFLPQTWNILVDAFKQIDNVHSTVSVECPIDQKSDDRLFHWTFSAFDAVSSRRSTLLTFVGKDITTLREQEKKLSLIFSAIPLGIVTVNRDLRIETPYSTYTELLLGRHSLGNVSAEDVIFRPSTGFMSKQQQEGVKTFFSMFGEEETWYDTAKAQFPTELGRGPENSQLPDSWIGLSYSPIVRRGIVDKVLIVIEDITYRVKQRQSNAHLQSKERKIAQLIVELESANPVLLSTCLEDLDGIFANLLSISKEKNAARRVCNALHGMKGVARTVNLTRFKELIHQVETSILAMLSENEAEFTPAMSLELEKVSQEWDSIKHYIKLLYPQTSAALTSGRRDELSEAMAMINQAVQLMSELSSRLPESYKADVANICNVFAGINQQPLRSIEARLNAFAEVTAKKLKKELRLHFQFQDINISNDSMRGLLEIFYHLLTNAIDHGIEPTESRQAAGKPEMATITLTATQTGHRLYFSFSDDGRGIDTAKVLSKAIDKGFVDPSRQLSESEIWNLCISMQLSTANAVTDTSGRGIGLGAVDEIVRKIGGKGLTITASAPGQGTRFEFSIANDRTQL